MLSNIAQKVAEVGFYFKNAIFQWGPKVTKYLGFFYKKICTRDLSKIAQSGHTMRTIVNWNL